MQKSDLQHGTHEAHVATIQRAQKNGVQGVWTGDIRRNPYLRETLVYCESIGLIKTNLVEGDQESYYEIEYLKEMPA